MKKIMLTIVIIILLVIGAYYLFIRNNAPLSSSRTPTVVNQPDANQREFPVSDVIATGFDTPWSLAFLPDNSILITERSGNVRLIDTNGNLSPTPLATLQNVTEIGEGGLMGLALHPDFDTNRYVYFYYTYNGSGDNTLNRVVRMTYENNTLSGEQTIVDAIPGAANHNGGRLKFGPDGMLYIATGDAQAPSEAQNRESLAGKILRVTDEGAPAPGNPFGNRIYSYGHRNPQGITWDDQGQLWATEHGPSGVETGNDELNKITAGTNYGWPEIRGTETLSGMQTPEVESGTGSTWAPGGIAFAGGKLYFVGLRGKALYQYDPQTKKLTEHFRNEFGRLREVIAVNGLLYLTTSNLDGRGIPQADDDRIIRVNPQKL